MAVDVLAWVFNTGCWTLPGTSSIVQGQLWQEVERSPHTLHQQGATGDESSHQGGQSVREEVLGSSHQGGRSVWEGVLGSSHQGGRSVREGVGRSLGCRVDHSRVRQADHCLQVVGTRQGSETTREREYTKHHKEDLLHALYTREHSSPPPSPPLPQSLCDLHNFSLVTHILDKRLVLQIGSHSFPQHQIPFGIDT